MMNATVAFFMLSSSGLCGEETSAVDPRNIRHGVVIPDEGYCDQPYVVITKDGNWLCTMTTGKGHEGQGGQHIVATISKDRGKTWSPMIDIEPADGPEASWAMPLVTPSGRVYVFYTYNGDRVDTLDDRRGIRADMLGWYVYKYSDDHGRTWSEKRWRLPVRMTEYDCTNDFGGKVQMFWGIGKPMVSAGRVYLGFSKIEEYLVSRTEGWFFRSENLLTETDPDKHEWVMLPKGDVGLRAPDGPIAEEQNLVAFSDGTLYAVYRTVAGFMCHAYSNDGGLTWSGPSYATYAPRGRKIKNPRACPRLWKTTSGNFLLWHHHHGGKDFKDRNPAWLSGGVEVEGRMHWSQPEIVLYDPDHAVRISYPDLVEEEGRYWITETQKSVARVHEIEASLIEGLWRQGKERRRVRAGLAISATVPFENTLEMPALAPLDEGGGFSLETTFHLQREGEGLMLQSRGGRGKGLVLVITPENQLRFEMSDGETRFQWETDPGVLRVGETHHVTLTVDGGPKIMTFIVDGVMCDGGEHRQYGWGRFPEALGSINSGQPMRVGQRARARMKDLHIYTRPLRTSEAVANYHAGHAR